MHDDGVVKSIHKVWTELIHEHGTIHGNDYINEITYDKDEDVFIVDFQHKSWRYHNGKRVDRNISFHTEIYKRNEIFIYNKNHVVGWDKAIKELLNEKAGITSTHIEWYNTRTSQPVNKDWWAKGKTEYIVNIDCMPRSVGFQKNGQLHHNYKPAAIGIRNQHVVTVSFYKDGKECIPPEQYYPSLIAINQTNSKLVQGYQGHAFGSTALTKMLSRVPKTRWDWLQKYKKILKINRGLRESFKYNDKDIPVELVPMMEYPLDDAAMFTLMLAT